MTVVRIPQIAERQPEFVAHRRDDILAQLLRVPVGMEVPHSPFEDLEATMRRNSELRRGITPTPNRPLAESTKGYLTHYVSRDKVVLPQVAHAPGPLDKTNVSLLIQALHAAFAEHVPFSF